MATSETWNDRFVRQQDLVPQQRLESLAVTVIGVGAIGRQVALQLVSLGVRRLQLVDFDTVEATNITTQGYWASDVGRPKVAATAEAARRVDPGVRIEEIQDRFRAKYSAGSAVFVGVDSIEARAAIWRSVGRHVDFWVDGRMLGEVIRVLAASDSRGRDYYPSTLFPESQAQPGRCTARSTVYAANTAAGLMLHQFARWLRGQAVDLDSILNLAAGEWTVTEAPSPA